MSGRGASRLWRFTPVIALATVIALLAIGALMALYIDRYTAAQEAREVDVQARVLAATVSAALSFKDTDAAQEYVNAVRANPEVEAAAIYDAQGRLFVSYPQPALGLPAKVDPGPPQFTGGRLVVVVPVREAGTTLGAVYLRNLTEPLARRIQRYGVIGLLVSMASLVIAVLGITHAALSRANGELESRATDLAIANRNLEMQIEQRAKAEEALRHAQKMEAIGQLTGGVAHDFNNLLQVILGSLERLEHRVVAAERVAAAQAHPLIEAAMRAGNRAAVLTQRLLAFSRRQPLAPTTLDVNRLVRGMSDLVTRTLGESISVKADLAADLWQVSADENQLENAVLNLAVNARDAMPDGGQLGITTRNTTLDATSAGRIEEAVEPGDYVLIAVADTGVGMTPEVRARAFDPFFTTKGVGQGTGLGLSQVYGFVRQSGGHVRIDSAPGSGTTVSLYLPRLVETVPAVSRSVDRRPVPKAARDETILLVEDQDEVRLFAADALRELGYRVEAVADGAAALRMLEAGARARLLFTDVGLPGDLDGWQLAREAQRRRPELRVLFTTGYGGDGAAPGQTVGPDMGLLRKPFSQADLARKVREALDR